MLSPTACRLPLRRKGERTTNERQLQCVPKPVSCRPNAESLRQSLQSSDGEQLNPAFLGLLEEICVPQMMQPVWLSYKFSHWFSTIINKVKSPFHKTFKHVLVLFKGTSDDLRLAKWKVFLFFFFQKPVC